MRHKQPDRDRAAERFRRQWQRALARAHEESESLKRLEAVFAEEDAELAARIGEDIMTDYKHRCRFCQSGFSLPQLLEEHEAQCGSVAAPSPHPAPPSPKSLRCRRCGEAFPSLKDLSAHHLKAHRAERQAAQRAAQTRVHADHRKIDAVLAAGPAPAPPTPPAEAPAERGVQRCPLCAGPLPPTTAQLVSELTRVGLGETQAFEAARIARQILATGA